jgi:hypothetical protein
LIDVPVTDLLGIYDIPDERLRAGEKWKKQEKDKERSEEEIEETKQLQANLYKPKVKLKIQGGFVYTLSTPFHEEISAILRRFTWEVGKRKAAQSNTTISASNNNNADSGTSNPKVEVKVTKLGVEIVQSSV